MAETYKTKEFKLKLKTFEEFLKARGAEVLHVTNNEWELCRFRTERGIGIIYTNSKGTLAFQGTAQEAYIAFKMGRAWRALPAPIRSRAQPIEYRTLRKRDGDLCFFCHKYVKLDEQSIEHLVPITSGGPNHISNMFLAHETCNQKHGHISGPEKIRVHTNSVMMLVATRLKEQYGRSSISRSNVLPINGTTNEI
jgi:hypothetical protein